MIVLQSVQGFQQKLSEWKVADFLLLKVFENLLENFVSFE